MKLVPKYDPAGSRNPAGFSGEIPQSRGIEKTRDLVNRTRGQENDLKTQLQFWLSFEMICFFNFQIYVSNLKIY